MNGYTIGRDFVATWAGAKAALTGDPGQYFGYDEARRWDQIALLALAPAVTLNIWTGQNGFLTMALLIGRLLQLDRRPLSADVLFGILSIKPQLGFLLPVMLVLTGRWRRAAAPGQ